MIRNSSPSTLTTPSDTGPLHPCTLTLSSSLISSPTDIPEIHHCVHTARPNKDGISICNSGQKRSCIAESLRTRISPIITHDQLQLYSPIQDVPLIELPQSVFDAGYLPCNSDTSNTKDSEILIPTTPTNVNHIP